MAYNWGKAAKDRRPDMARAANPVCYDIFWKTRHAKEKRIMDGMMQHNMLIAQQQQQQQQDSTHLPMLNRKSGGGAGWPLPPPLHIAADF